RQPVANRLGKLPLSHHRRCPDQVPLGLLASGPPSRSVRSTASRPLYCWPPPPRRSFRNSFFLSVRGFARFKCRRELLFLALDRVLTLFNETGKFVAHFATRSFDVTPSLGHLTGKKITAVVGRARKHFPGFTARLRGE